MILKLKVWLIRPTGEIVNAGELAVGEPDFRGALEGQFRYSREYLEDRQAFPLDPLHLPLVEGAQNADRPHSGVHGVIEDSLPDDWGRALMARRYRLGRAEQRVPHLLRLLGDQGIGALAYTEGENPSPSTPGVSSLFVEELAMKAERFEREPLSIPDDELALLFRAGSSPGGARPKALVVDENGAYLAKFPSARDRLDVVRLEAAAMALAKQAGLETAQTSVLSCGTRSCLLVKRFDINKAGGRNHLISMQSLLKADGYYNAGYRDMANVIKRVSSAPQQDLHMLYRQMLFNVMIGNTDDHLKNFYMLHDEKGWRLSPAFDLVPNIGFNQEHVLRIGYEARVPDIRTILDEAPFFGIKRRQQALDIVAAVHGSVAGWRQVFTAFGVPVRDCETIAGDIDQRLKRTKL